MRNLESLIERDLKRKFVFLAGPRQVGKTHLAKHLLQKLQGKYYNWDLAEDRHGILSKVFLHDKMAVLDELHKYDRWKNFLKGIYDKYHESLHILVTGSARLDIYRKGGDSLLGRYFLYHLYPLTLGELYAPEKIAKPEELFHLPPLTVPRSLYEQLFKFGGFPEPFFDGTEEYLQRWAIQRNELLVREDIRDLTNINLLSLIEHLLILLPDRVGSVLSITSLKEDLQVAYNTVVSWIETFKKLYILYTLQSFTNRVGRSIHKENKLYLWDWSQVKDAGNRFENLIAGHLMKAVQIWRDLGFGDFALHFLRDRDRREVDFCIIKDRRPWLLVEAKLADLSVAEPLAFFANRFQVPALQLVHTPNIHKLVGPIRILSADQFLGYLP